MLKEIMNNRFNGSGHLAILKKEAARPAVSGKPPFDTVLSVLDSLPEHIAVLDFSGSIVVTNRSWDSDGNKDSGGPDARPLLGSNYLYLLSKHLAASSARLRKNIVSVLEGRKEKFSMEYASRSGKGRRWFLLTVTPLIYGSDITGAVISHADITRRKTAELETRRFSATDPMTGILNRKAGLESVYKQMKYCERHGCSFTVCYIDLDNLKRVNDSFGHKEGDRIIISFVNMLRRALRESDVMCRLGGDEILLILQETGLEAASAVLKRIQISVDAGNSRSSKPYRIEFSYGFAEFTLGSGITPEELIHTADRRMYEMKSAKKHGKNGNYGRL